MKPDIEKGVRCYLDADLAVGLNQEEVKDLRSVLYITGYVRTYVHCLIIWASRIQTEIALSIKETE